MGDAICQALNRIKRDCRCTRLMGPCPLHPLREKTQTEAFPTASGRPQPQIPWGEQGGVCGSRKTNDRDCPRMLTMQGMGSAEVGRQEREPPACGIPKTTNCWTHTLPVWIVHQSVSLDIRNSLRKNGKRRSLLVG